MTGLAHIIFNSFFINALSDDSYVSHIYRVPCGEDYIPHNCNFPNVTLDVIKSVEDFDRCGPAVLSRRVRDLYWGAAGRKRTYERNFRMLKRVVIVPRVLRDVSGNTTGVNLLGSTIKIPVGIAPTAAHTLGHPDGEVATAMAAAEHGTVFILSSSSTTSIEEVASAAFLVNKNAVLWAQTYIMVNRTEVVEYIRRCEHSGFKAIVATIDSPVDGDNGCNGKSIEQELKYPNLAGYVFPNSKLDKSLTFQDLAWLVSVSHLPVVAKGIVRGDDAIQAAKAGVAAVYVSNQGGRQMDEEISSVEALVDIVQAMQVMKYRFPNVEIYMDGAIRGGYDVFKALALGAKTVFVGRPALWGLAIGGQEGVSKMLQLMTDEFVYALLIGGYSRPSAIGRKAVRLPREGLWD